MDAHSAPIGSPNRSGRRRSASKKPIARSGAHTATRSDTRPAPARKKVPATLPKVEPEDPLSKERTRPIRVQVDTGIARQQSFRRVAMTQASQLRLGMRWYQALTNVIHPLLFVLGLVIAWHVGMGRIWETGSLTAAVMYRVNPRLRLVDILFTPPVLVGALLHLLAFVALRRMSRRAPLASTLACIVLPLMWLVHDIWQSVAIGGRVGVLAALSLFAASVVLAIFDWNYLQKRRSLFVH